MLLSQLSQGHRVQGSAGGEEAEAGGARNKKQALFHWNQEKINPKSKIYKTQNPKSKVQNEKPKNEKPKIQTWNSKEQTVKTGRDHTGNTGAQAHDMETETDDLTQDKGTERVYIHTG